jgi:hypothetical protein
MANPVVQGLDGSRRWIVWFDGLHLAPQLAVTECGVASKYGKAYTSERFSFGKAFHNVILTTAGVISEIWSMGG